MARIRIIDEWLRSPVSAPSRSRAVVVVADSWSEQRVLMRAFAASTDQTRPAISLRGVELAIGPAGVDPHGPWGVHVEPPVDGRAQELRGQLEEAARRLAGSRRNPPRLEDEEPASDRAPTNVWLPVQRRSAPPHPDPRDEADRAAAGPAGKEAALGAPGRRRASKRTEELFPVSRRSSGGPASVDSPAARPLGAKDHRSNPSSATVAGTARAVARTRAPGPSEGAPLDALVFRTMPLGFQLTSTEREVLKALGNRGELAAAEVAALVGAGDGEAWMEALMAKLAEHGLDLVIPGQGRDGATVFWLRR